jgi:hypothetical protein
MNTKESASCSCQQRLQGIHAADAGCSERSCSCAAAALSSSSSADWQLKGEGNANVVLAYTGSHPCLVSSSWVAASCSCCWQCAGRQVDAVVSQATALTVACCSW